MEALDSNGDTRIDFGGRLTYHIKTQINDRHFPDDIFKLILMKYLNHDYNFIELCPHWNLGSNWQ